MKNEIDFIDFWYILWKGKFIIIFLTFIFLSVGFISDYYYKPIIHRHRARVMKIWFIIKFPKSCGNEN